MNNIALIKKIRLGFKYPRSGINSITDIISGRFTRHIAYMPFPRLVTLYVTNQCNLNCAMCLNAEFRNTHLKASKMEYETVERMLPELKKHKPFIYITGGEPLLNPDIFRIIRLLSDNGIFTSMTTNGFMLENYAQQLIDSKLEFLSVSLDHYSETVHDEGRGRKKAYERLMKGINAVILKKKHTPSNIKVNTVVQKFNIKDLSKMYDFIEKMNVDEWSLQNYSFMNPEARGSLKKFKDRYKFGDYADGIDIDSKEYLTESESEDLLKEIEKLREKSKKNKTKLSIKPQINDLKAYYQGNIPSYSSYCEAPFNALNIMDNSKVISCMGYELGDLNGSHETLGEIWKSEKNRKFQKMVREGKIFPPCFRCCSLNYIFE